MNKRILEIAKQSGISILYEYDGYDGHAAVMSLEDVKKFAELLVAECAQVANDNFNSGFCPVGDFIKQHFGAEE